MGNSQNQNQVIVQDLIDLMKGPLQSVLLDSPPAECEQDNCHNPPALCCLDCAEWFCISCDNNAHQQTKSHTKKQLAAASATADGPALPPLIEAEKQENEAN